MGTFLAKTIKINIWALLLAYSLYALGSGYLFATTTSGYRYLLNITLSVIVYGFFFLLLIVGAIIRVGQSKTKTEFLYALFGVVTVPAQMVMLFLNTGDCGDSPCAMGYEPNMFRHLFRLAPIHSYQAEQVTMVVAAVYVISLFVVISGALVGSSKKH